MITFSSSPHQFAAPQVLTSKCPSDTYGLTPVNLFSEVPPLDPTCMHINPFIGNTQQLSFDLTIAYFFYRAVSISPRDLVKKYFIIFFLK